MKNNTKTKKDVIKKNKTKKDDIKKDKMKKDKMKKDKMKKDETKKDKMKTIMLDDICAICNEFPSGDIRILSCGHVYHTLCIRTWFLKNASCPQCRNQNLIEKKLEKLENLEVKAPINIERQYELEDLIEHDEKRRTGVGFEIRKTHYYEMYRNTIPVDTETNVEIFRPSDAGRERFVEMLIGLHNRYTLTDTIIISKKDLMFAIIANIVLTLLYIILNFMERRSVIINTLIISINVIAGVKLLWNPNDQNVLN